MKTAAGDQRAIVVVMATLGGLACGDSGVETITDDPTEAGSVRVLRVDISGTDASPTIRRARVLDIRSDIPTLPSLAGTIALVAYSNDSGPVAAIPFSLPTVLRVERGLMASASEGSADASLVPLSEGSLSVYLSTADPIERIEVVNAAGDVLSGLGAADFEMVGLPSARLLQAGRTPSSLDEIRRAFPHIDFLGPDDEVGWLHPLGIDPRIDEMLTIEGRILPALMEGLSRTPPKALGALRRLGVARFREPFDPLGTSTGSTVVLNVNLDTLPLETVAAVVHEATHTYANLVDSGGPSLVSQPWPDDVRAAAQVTMARFNLEAGLESVWGQIQEDAVEANIGGEYLGSDWEEQGTGLAGDRVAGASGFAAAYGATDAGEDLAVYVERLIVSEAGYESPVCALVRNAADPFPPEHALPYIKIKLLESLELLSQQQVLDCIGTPALEGPPGIHFPGFMSLTMDLRGGYIDVEGGHFLAVLARREEYQMLIRVLAPEEQPRGVYRLDNIGYFDIDDPQNAVLLGHDTNTLLARTSARGMVLISEFDDTKLAGAVFFLSLRNAGGFVVDTYPFGTFRVNTD